MEYTVFRQKQDKNMANNPAMMEIVNAGPFVTSDEAATWIIEHNTDEYDYFIVPRTPTGHGRPT